MNMIAKLFAKTPNAADIQEQLKEIEHARRRRQRDLILMEGKKQEKTKQAINTKKAGRQAVLRDIFRDMSQIEMDIGYANSDLRRLSLEKSALTSFLRKIEILEQKKDHQGIQNLITRIRNSSIQNAIDKAEVNDAAFNDMLADILGEEEGFASQGKEKDEAGFAEFDKTIGERAQAEEIESTEPLRTSSIGGIATAATPTLMSGLLSAMEAEGVPPKLELDPQMLNRVIQAALKRGGEFAEVYVEHKISQRILMEESKVKQAIFGIRQGAGVRVISGNKTGYAYTDEISEEKLKRAADAASYVARGSNLSIPMDVRKSERPSFITVRISLESVADARRIEVMQRADQAALSYDSRIKMAVISYNDEVRGRTIANSEGLLVTDELPLLFFTVDTLGVGNNTRHMGHEGLSLHAGFEMFDQVTPEELARRSARESIAMLSAEACPAGKMDVVMENGQGGVLVHEAVGHPLEADNIAKRVGTFADQMGQKVAQDIFTLVDDGSLPGARGTTNFDDEGTPMKRNVLIEKGAIQLFMTDILSAKQLKMTRTGNGRRESFRFPPIPRMTNTFIANGTEKAEDILASTKKGIYVQGLKGGSVDEITGIFNFTCRESYLIEDGKKTKPLKGATLIGSCMDIISNIDAVGNDLSLGPGTCGKKGQNAATNVGQPTVRIRGINVGGSRA